jgi:hypothetical protein
MSLEVTERLRPFGSSRKDLVVESCDDERMMREPGFPHYPINLGLAGKVGNVELAATDRFYIRKR